MSKQDYYEVLGVSKTATLAEIKSAFRTKAKTCHPDYHPGDAQKAEEFKVLAEAYGVLSDEQKRSAYDRFGHSAFDGSASGGFGGFGGFSGMGGFEGIFEEIFSGFTGGSSRSSTRSMQGSDVRVDLEISLEEAYKGLKKKIQVETFVACKTCQGKGGKDFETCSTCRGQGYVRRQQGFFMMQTECPVCHGTGRVIKDPCSDCKGTGRVRLKRELEVNIPPGVETGIRMRLSGEGDAGFNGTQAGDLYVFLTVKEHPVFAREGNDLFCQIPIDMTVAILGGEIEVPLIDGKKETLSVKPGTQPSTRVRLKQKGMPVLKGGGFGDLYVDLMVEVPQNLNARQKELIQQFAEERKNNTSAYADFLKKIKTLWN